MGGGKPAERCGACVHFDNVPADLEAVFPGMLSLGSAHGSARAEDGLCLLHDRYLNADAWCPGFEAIERPAASRTPAG